MPNSPLALALIAVWAVTSLGCDRRRTEEDHARARERLVPVRFVPFLGRAVRGG